MTRMLWKFCATATAGVAACAIWMVSPAEGQAPATKSATPATKTAASSYKAPRLAGRPNLNGIWQALNSANWDLEGHASAPPAFWQMGAIGAAPAGQSVVEGGEIPYLPAALEKKKANAKNRLALDPEAKCYMPGVPRATYMPFPFQIIQSAKVIMMGYEFASAVRTVYMDGKDKAPVDSWMGWSNGHWEGETLVVDVTGQLADTWFDRAGNHHSEQLHVVERYMPRSADTMRYEATMEDPKTFSRPWKISMPLYRRVEKNAQLMEFKCVEYSEEILYGNLRKKTDAK